MPTNPEPSETYQTGPDLLGRYRIFIASKRRVVNTSRAVKNRSGGTAGVDMETP